MKIHISMLLLIVIFKSNAQDFDVDQYSVSFEISNTAFNTVKGKINGLKGAVLFDKKNLEASYFDVCLDVTTLSTGNQKRDEHLQEEEWFNTEKYPSICFKSNQLIETKSGFKAVGELTMHGYTKQVEFPFKLDNEELKGKLTLDRQAYEVGGSSLLVGDEVKIEMEFRLNK